MIEKTENCKIPTKIVPVCPVCGKRMEVNVRIDANFVQDDNWYKQDKKYGEFLDYSKNKNVVLLVDLLKKYFIILDISKAY